MNLRSWTVFATLAAIAACSGEPASKTPNATPNNGTNTGSNNMTTPSNDGTCGGRLCPGACIDNGDGWCVVDNFVSAFHIAMWVHSPDEIWLAEQSGNVRVGSGTSWEEHPVPGVNQINDILGTASGQVWVTTHPTGVYRWDGGGWVEETIVDPPADTGLGRLAYDEATDTLFVGGQHDIYQRVGERWEKFAAVEGGELQNVVTCGGTRWFASGYPVTVDASGFAARWGLVDFNRVATAGLLASGEVVAGGDQVVFYDGAYKSIAATFLNRATSLGGTSLQDIWSVVDRFNATEIWHYDGRHWSLIKEYDTLRDVGSVFTDTPGQVRVTFVHGASEVIDLSGAVLSTVPVPAGANSSEKLPAHHLSMNEYWIGRSGMSRWTAAGGWETTRPGPSSPISLWGASVDDVWFLTDRAEIYRADAADEQLVSTGFANSTTLEVIRGTDAGHVWVAGNDQVLQWDGSRWIEHVGFDAGGAEGEDSVALAARGDEAWVFRRDDVFHWDGAAWNHVGPQRHVVRVGCENNELVAMASYPPALLRGEPDQFTSIGDIPTDTEVSAARGWMTRESDAWVITHQLPFVHRWANGEHVVSLDNPGVQLLDIEALPSGEAYLLGTTTLFVRRP